MGTDGPETPSCEFYNITNSDHMNLYTVNEMIEIYARFEGNTPLQYESVSTSYLNVIDGYVPASMQMTETNFGTVLSLYFQYRDECVNQLKLSLSLFLSLVSQVHRILPFLQPTMIRMQSYQIATKESMRTMVVRNFHSIQRFGHELETWRKISS